MRVLPVADTTATRASAASAAPTSPRPSSTCDKPSGTSPTCVIARRHRASQASAVSGVFSDGFHTTALPQTKASAAFQAHTATGKLKALMTPTTPIGCQVSIIRWPGRSEAIVRPYNCRDRPTAKSQMSIISCTSPRPSCTILPDSMVTRRASPDLCWRRSSPNTRTHSPRRGAGTSRQVIDAARAAPILAATVVASSQRRCAVLLPSIGVRTSRSAPACAARSTPSSFNNAVRSMRSPCTRAIVSGGCADQPTGNDGQSGWRGNPTASLLPGAQSPPAAACLRAAGPPSRRCPRRW